MVSCVVFLHVHYLWSLVVWELMYMYIHVEIEQGVVVLGEAHLDIGVLEGLEGGLVAFPCPIAGISMCKPPAGQHNIYNGRKDYFTSISTVNFCGERGNLPLLKTLHPLWKS